MALMAPMSLKLILRGPGVHNACHTTLSLQPSSNGDLFLPQRATADFNHTRITPHHHHNISSTRTVQSFLVLVFVFHVYRGYHKWSHTGRQVKLSRWKSLEALHQVITALDLLLSFWFIYYYQAVCESDTIATIRQLFLLCRSTCRQAAL